MRPHPPVKALEAGADRTGTTPIGSMVVIAAILMLTVAAVWAALWTPPPPATPPPSRPEPELVRPIEPAANAVVPRETEPERIDRVTLGRGGTLDSALGRVGVPEAERAEYLEAFLTKLDPRRLPNKTGLSAAWSGDGHLLAVSCRAATDRVVRVTRNGAGALVARDWSIPILAEVETAAGVVEQSVAQALDQHPLSPALVPAFADVFQWDVDLLVDPRPGDVVRVVFEVLHVGDVPVDVPTFGDQATRPGDLAGLGGILAASYHGERAEAEAYWVEDGEGRGDYYDGDGLPLRKTFLKSPLNYRRISSGFSRARRNPVTRRVVPHHGVDFAAPTGTPVAAAADGAVVSAGWSGALGRAVRIRHGSEYATVYGHLSRIAAGAHTGARVRQGQIIGYVGATGRATGPHLHYAMYRRGAPINPLRLDNPAVEPLPERLIPVLDRARSAWGPVLASLDPSSGSGGTQMVDASGSARAWTFDDPRPLFR